MVEVSPVRTAGIRFGAASPFVNLVGDAFGIGRNELRTRKGNSVVILRPAPGGGKEKGSNEGAAILWD